MPWSWDDDKKKVEGRPNEEEKFKIGVKYGDNKDDKNY